MRTVFEAFAIPHDRQRYRTVGDWTNNRNGSPCVMVSEMSEERYEQLVAVHELIEALICRHRNIRQEDVDTFDQLFEHERGVGRHGPHDEPGDDPRAPYRDAHRFATIVEMMLARELGVDWAAYEAEIEAL